MGSAGPISAVTTLARRLSPRGGLADSKPGLVTREQMEAALERLRETSQKDRRKLGVEEHRADIIYCGAAILVGILRKLRVDEVEITSRGLRDGLMVDLVRRTVRPPAAG